MTDSRAGADLRTGAVLATPPDPRDPNTLPAPARGGELICGGTIEDGILLPTIVDDPPLDWDLCRKKAFGPMSVILGYADLDEALEPAGNTSEGPAYSVREMTELRFVSFEP